jgi:sigma-54 dependent transcriptional regulator, acetoin dehydrogenase operon transcriptional activator AcoR
MSPQRLIQGKKARNLFLDKGLLDRRLVRAEVAQSWQRCQNLRVNPQQSPDSDTNESCLLEEKLHRKQDLCRVARPFMRDLYYFVSGSEFQVILTDEDGYLLEVLGDPKILSRTRNVHLCPGARWSEAAKGTNAIGTALVEKQPVQIFAWEHFCEHNQFLTCSAAPIQDVDGAILGVLDVSGDCRYANPHTLGMVVATVRAIENQLRLEQTNHKLYIASRYSTALTQGISDGLLTIDRNGIITEINGKGGEILGVNAAQAKGRHLEIVCGPAPLLRVLEGGREYQDEDILLEKVGKRIRSSASAIRDESGGIVGAVAVLRDISDRQPPKRPVITFSRHWGFDDIIGQSPAMAAAKEWASLAAGSASTVLILGESGTGKELFANAIHTASSRSQFPFVAINCAALPESLIESELFGYSDGSFTGARKGGQAGKFEMANGGTVFLDEIGDMSLSVQAKLLRVIQERKVARIGSAQEVPVDIRIIAATHKDLKAEVQRRNFREDLYYRLSVLEILIPPLRDHKEDLPDLARALVAKIASSMRREPVRIDEGFLEKLYSYHWPGNVRELENAIERAMVRSRDNPVLDAHGLQLPDEGQQQAPPVPQEPPVRSVPASIKPLREIEKQAITDALSCCNGNIVQTAARLGICRNTLYRKLEEYQLSPHSNS